MNVPRQSARLLVQDIARLRREPAATLRLTAARQTCLASAPSFCPGIEAFSFERGGDYGDYRLARMLRRQQTTGQGACKIKLELAEFRSGAMQAVLLVSEADTEERKRLRSQEEEANLIKHVQWWCVTADCRPP